MDAYEYIRTTALTEDGYTPIEITKPNPITGFVEGPGDFQNTSNPYGLFGYFASRGRVSVHRVDCKNVKSLVKERIVEVSWADQARGVFMVQIQVEALDRSGLLSDVTRVLTESHVNILSASVSTGRDRVAISKFVFEMADPSHLDHLLNQVRRIDNVYDVYRVKSA